MFRDQPITLIPDQRIKWNLGRNIHEKELEFIYNLLSKRKDTGRPSEVVVSGKVWSEREWLKRLDRRKSSWSPRGRLLGHNPFVTQLDEFCVPVQLDIDLLPDFLARVHLIPVDVRTSRVVQRTAMAPVRQILQARYSLSSSDKAARTAILKRLQL